MNNDIDEWLSTLGFESSGSSEQPEQTALPEATGNEPTLQVNSPEPQPQSLSDDDFNDILGDYGFTPPEIVEAEEITEEESEEEEVVENTEESRDLDAEEDADWQEAIDSGSISPVIMEANTQGIAIEAPSTPEEAMSFPQRESLIPLNSPTLLMDESTTRFSGAEWFNEIQRQNIIVAGCGGIGRMKNFL